MNILLTFDNNYSQHAGVVMVSFCMNNKGRHDFYVISDEIHDDNQQKLKAIAKQCFSSPTQLQNPHMTDELLESMDFLKDRCDLEINRI